MLTTENQTDKTVLGLDLGTNSIGWALIKNDNELLDLGVRIFPMAVEAKTPTPKSQARRSARLLRRVIRRRAQRKSALRAYLIGQNLLPAELANNPNPEILLNDLGENPYKLRAEALDRELTPYELGRALLHLGARRGFLSTRTLMLSPLLADPDVRAELQELENAAQQGDSEADALKNEAEKEAAKEEGKILQGIEELRTAMQNMGAKTTLGQYLNSLPAQVRKRNHYTARDMYETELEAIIKAQKDYHPQLTAEFEEKIQDIIFFQRQIYWHKKTIGKCSLEPKCKRTQVVRPEYQRYRYWQDLHNILWTAGEAYTDTDTGEVTFLQNQELTAKQKQTIAEILEKQKSLSWAKLKKELNLPKKCQINLEAAKKQLTGNLTACSLRKIYPAWDTLGTKKQEQLTEDLLSFEKVTPLKNRLLNYWHCDTKTAVALINFSRENNSERAALSLKALRKILPFMTAKNMSVTKAKEAAGYEIKTANTRVLDLLPPPADC